jgi:hypothetical protein
MNTYRLAECRESITSIGVVWPVEMYVNNGRCGCGAHELAGWVPVAFFTDRGDAMEWVA